MKLSGVMKSIANNKYILNQAEKIGGDVSNYAAKFAVASICLKDGLGCYYYVTQSLKNERIPEEKRKFVASLDLMNGILNITTQLVLGATVTNKKFLNYLNNKLFGDLLKEDKIKLAHEKIKKLPKLNKISLESFDKSMKGVSKYCTGGLGVIISLVTASIIAKRMLVPFIATPLAGWYKGKYMDKNTKQPAQPTQPTKQNPFAQYIAYRQKKLNLQGQNI